MQLAAASSWKHCFWVTKRPIAEIRFVTKLPFNEQAQRPAYRRQLQRFIRPHAARKDEAGIEQVGHGRLPRACLDQVWWASLQCGLPLHDWPRSQILPTENDQGEGAVGSRLGSLEPAAASCPLVYGLGITAAHIIKDANVVIKDRAGWQSRQLRDQRRKPCSGIGAGPSCFSRRRQLPGGTSSAR